MELLLTSQNPWFLFEICYVNLKSSLLNSSPPGSPAVHGYGGLYAGPLPPDTQVGNTSMEIDETPYRDSVPFH